MIGIEKSIYICWKFFFVHNFHEFCGLYSNNLYGSHFIFIDLQIFYSAKFSSSMVHVVGTCTVLYRECPLMEVPLYSFESLTTIYGNQS